jgi:hypothetical protein
LLQAAHFDPERAWQLKESKVIDSFGSRGWGAHAILSAIQIP